MTKLVEGLNDAARGMMGFCGNLCRQGLKEILEKICAARGIDGLETCDPKGVIDSDQS